jgi:hypothetical protein
MKAKPSQIIQGKLCWHCPTCNSWIAEAEFYKDNRTANGLKSQCKSCHIQCSIESRDPINARRLSREHMRRARLTNVEKFRIRDRLAARKRDKKSPAIVARQLLNIAVRSGRITAPTKCEECGGRHKLSAHHNDYTKPLSVEWLCYECHGKRTSISFKQLGGAQ